MKLIIDIPKEIYEASKIIDVQYEDVVQIPLEVIANGIPLSKGHGRIIDERKITKCQPTGLYIIDGNVSKCLITDAPTIIEADKAESEDKE